MDRNAPKGLFTIVIIIGLLLVIIPSIYITKRENKSIDYIETTAIFIRAEKSMVSDSGTQMYKLIYTYKVNGVQYYYESDCSTSVIPKEGSKIKIKYNPVMPSYAYSNSFNVANVFQTIGMFFICIPLIMLFSEMIWLRDLIMALFTGGLILIFIINKLYNGAFIIAIIILGIMCFLAIMDLFSYLKNNDFRPLQDIKEEIIKTKKIKLQKKEAKKNLSDEERALRVQNRNSIIKGILMFLIPVPLVVFIDIQFGYPNQIIYWIFVFISIICTFMGFFIVCMAIIGFDPKNSVMTVAGKVINNEDIRRVKDMSLKEKIKAFNIMGLIGSIIGIAVFFGTIFLIFEDPFEWFANFENVGRIQIFLVLGIVCALNFLFLIFKNKNHTKTAIILYIVSCIILFITVYFNTMSSDSSKVTITSEEFKQIMTYNEFVLLDEKNTSNINCKTIINAIKNNIQLDYYEFEDIKTAKKEYERLKENYLKNSKNYQALKKGEYFEVDSEGLKKTWIISRVKNTIVYGEIDYENKEELIRIINLIGYN